jgi:hypothetical protein
MANFLTPTQVGGSLIGSSLDALLCCDEIVPGAVPSYEIVKTIFSYHPLGKKMAEGPIAKAQSLPRQITVPDAPDEVAQEFIKQWIEDEADKTILGAGTVSRIYGISTLALLEKGTTSDQPLRLNKLADAEIAFNTLDPLNTSGSLVLNQDPNAMDFMKHRDVAVNGVRYHRSRVVVLLHEQPIYIEWSNTAYGFVGRSVFQRALYPLKSFVQTMRADDMIARKVGLLVAVLKMASNVVDRIMTIAAAFKRQLLKQGVTDNVLSIGEGEEVQSLDLTNMHGVLDEARKHILENIAAAADMPAKLLNNETFAEGFGEGTEDAKQVAEFVDTVRKWLQPLYSFMDMVVQRRAWNKRFFETMQRKFPEAYGDMEYDEAFYRWQNAFSAVWPSLLREPESDLIEVEKVKSETLIAMAEVLMPTADPDNKATIVQWIADNLNTNKRLFGTPLVLDYEKLAEHMATIPQPGTGEGADGDDGDEAGIKEPAAPKPFSSRTDAALGGRVSKVEDFLRRNGRAIATISRQMR